MNITSNFETLLNKTLLQTLELKKSITTLPFPLQTSKEIKQWEKTMKYCIFYFILFIFAQISKNMSVGLLLFQHSGDANQSVAFKLEQLTKLIYSIEDKVSLFFVYGSQQTWQYSYWKLFCRLSHLIYRPSMLCLKLWDMMEDTESHLFLLWHLK